MTATAGNVIFIDTASPLTIANLAAWMYEHKTPLRFADAPADVREAWADEARLLLGYLRDGKP